MVFNRRDLIAKCAALGVVSLAPNLNAETAAEGWLAAEDKARSVTPTAEVGPFYKRGAPNTAMLRMAGDPGLPLQVSGVIYDTRGEVLPGAKMEIWQTNYNGHYDLEGYHYRAALIAGGKGEYDFQSVIPGHYPARVCQHIHFVVMAEGHRPLVTQMYFATDPVFAGDPDKNYTKDPLITARELVRPVTLKVEDAQGLVAGMNFELVLERL